MKNTAPEYFHGLKNFEEDRLLPLESANFVAENSSGQVKINYAAVKDAAHWILDEFRKNDIDSSLLFSAQPLHPKTFDQKAVDWIFLIDTINFSFWTEGDHKFRVNYKGEVYSGYFGACACVNRALDSGTNLTSALCMSKITEDDVERIFLANNRQLIPLSDQRAQVISEVGKVLLEKFGGTFYNCLKQCNKSAMKLLSIVVENFKCYRDYAVYKGQKISFLKRAQILVADIYYCLKGHDDLADFDDINEITMFADYRIPQTLAFRSVLQYSEEMKGKLKSRVIMDQGSADEVEIRAFSIKAVNEIVEEIKKIRTSEDSKVPEITPAKVDNFLWSYRRKHAKEIDEAVDFHRVRSIYY